MAAAEQVLTLDEARRALDGGQAERAGAVCAELVKRDAKNAAAWHLLGLARHKLGRHAEAVEALNKAAALDRGAARYPHDLGNALLDDGKIDRAISAYRRSLRLDDTRAEAHNDLGTAYFEKGWHAEAEGCFRKAIGHDPAHGVAYANLGAALRAQGKLKESRQAFQRALRLKLRGLLPRFLRWKVSAPPPPAPAGPSPAAAAIGEASRALTMGKVKEGLELARAAQSRFPEDPDALHLLAVALEENRELEAALETVDRALALKPELTEYHVSRARILMRASRNAEALEAAERALRLEPGRADTYATMAGIYQYYRDDLAEQAARKAIELDPASAVGHGNLASALWSLGRLEEAEHHAREALRLAPSQLSFRANLALILKDRGRIDETRAMYHDMVRDAPDYPKLALDMATLAIECDGDLEAGGGWYRKAQAASGQPRAYLLEATANLLEGRFDPGWDQYESRKTSPDQKAFHGLFGKLPEWRGEPLEGRRLVVYDEQGLGDEVMFASMFGDLAQRAGAAPGAIRVMCDPRLVALFRRSFPAFEVIEQGDLEGLDLAVAAGSLGRVLRRRAEDFPAHRGYLVPDAAKAAGWRARLAEAGPGLKVGLSWVGGLQRTGRARRSLSLERLRPLLSLPGMRWVSLQYTDCAAELAEFEAASGIRVQAYEGVTRDMDELAALIEALDVVVSVCNTTVHVAGAIGKEVLVMAPVVPEWRYGLRGERMLWYPSARVFRQARYGEWDPVVAAIGAALARRAAPAAAG